MKDWKALAARDPEVSEEILKVLQQDRTYWVEILNNPRASLEFHNRVFNWIIEDRVLEGLVLSSFIGHKFTSVIQIETIYKQFSEFNDAYRASGYPLTAIVGNEKTPEWIIRDLIERNTNIKRDTFKAMCLAHSNCPDEFIDTAFQFLIAAEKSEIYEKYLDFYLKRGFKDFDDIDEFLCLVTASKGILDNPKLDDDRYCRLAKSKMYTVKMHLAGSRTLPQEAKLILMFDEDRMVASEVALRKDMSNEELGAMASHKPFRDALGIYEVVFKCIAANVNCQTSLRNEIGTFVYLRK